MLASTVITFDFSVSDSGGLFLIAVGRIVRRKCALWYNRIEYVSWMSHSFLVVLMMKIAEQDENRFVFSWGHSLVNSQPPWCILKGTEIIFLKHLFVFITKSDIYKEEEWHRGRSFIRWFIPQVAAMGDLKPGARNIFPGVPRGYRVPMFWAILDCFPGP